MGLKVKFKKIIFVGALVLAIAIGTITTPIIGSAQGTDPKTNVNNNYNRGDRLGLHHDGLMRDTVAKTLGITVDELCTLRSSGKSIAQIAKEKGISSKDLVDKLTKARTDQVEQLFKDGKITAAQKDWVLTDLKSRIEENINRTDVSRGHGRGFHGNCNNSNNSTN